MHVGDERDGRVPPARLVVTPHTGFVCESVVDAFRAGCVANLDAWLDGRAMPHVPAATGQKAAAAAAAAKL
jgi:lactate dehydrogenase-like 2-hydroxyacid dehydrogenase